MILLTSIHKLNFSTKLVIFSTELSNKTNEIGEINTKFRSFSSVCRIHLTISDPIINSNLEKITNELRFNIHSGSMIDEKILYQELSLIIFSYRNTNIEFTLKLIE